MKRKFADKVVRIFIHADRDTVIARQKERGNTDQEIELHLKHFDEDLKYRDKCEHSVQNYELAHTIFEVTQTIEKYLVKNS